jgi:hypothetical protein
MRYVPIQARKGADRRGIRVVIRSHMGDCTVMHGVGGSEWGYGGLELISYIDTSGALNTIHSTLRPLLPLPLLPIKRLLPTQLLQRLLRFLFRLGARVYPRISSCTLNKQQLLHGRPYWDCSSWPCGLRPRASGLRRCC